MLLEETKKNIEKEVGLTISQLRQMDLDEITEYIERKKGIKIDHSPKNKFSYLASGSVYYFFNRFITRDEIDRGSKVLIKKYLR